jgi:hypothetical protein
MRIEKGKKLQKEGQPTGRHRDGGRNDTSLKNRPKKKEERWRETPRERINNRQRQKGRREGDTQENDRQIQRGWERKEREGKTGRDRGRKAQDIPVSKMVFVPVYVLLRWYRNYWYIIG